VALPQESSNRRVVKQLKYKTSKES